MRDDVIHRCDTCVYGKILPTGEDVLCSRYGPVPPDGVCKKYKYNIFLPPPPKKRNAKTYQKKDFEL